MERALSASRLFAAIFVCTSIVGVQAQDRHDSDDARLQARVDSAWTAYQRLDYSSAEEIGQSVLDAYSEYGTGQLTQVNVLLGLIFYTRNDIDGARNYFQSGLSLDPNLELDPLLVSPKIMAFFEETKSEWNGEQRPPSNGATRYVILQDPRPAAALRSMVVPGWGQLYKGQKKKGRILLGAWSLAVAGTVISEVRRSDTRSTYLDETNPDLIAKRFDSFNSWHKARNTFLLGAAVIWMYSYVDAIVMGKPARRSALSVGVSASPEGTLATMSLRF